MRQNITTIPYTLLTPPSIKSPARFYGRLSIQAATTIIVSTSEVATNQESYHTLLTMMAVILAFLLFVSPTATTNDNVVAVKPPMGWQSWYFNVFNVDRDDR